MRRLVALIVASVVLGGCDQYLGSLSAHPWGADVSLLSAPWLLIAFAAGWTQPTPKRAALVGYLCTLAALIGYGLMTLSPIENAQLTVPAVAAFVRSERLVFIGSFVSGPLFGWLGYRRSMYRSWLVALVAAATLCLEPLARSRSADAIRFRSVSTGEIAAGLAIAIYACVSASPYFRSMKPTSTR